MAILNTRAQLLSKFATGAFPSESDFSALISQLPLIHTEPVTLLQNTDLEVTHSAGENARIVQLTDSTGKEINVSWRRDPSDPTNKIILNSGKAYASAEVSILFK
ncbi:MAG: hypothetical protein ACPGD8_00925 [Flavobacteriales bacterium]